MFVLESKKHMAKAHLRCVRVRSVLLARGGGRTAAFEHHEIECRRERYGGRLVGRDRRRRGGRVERVARELVFKGVAARQGGLCPCAHPAAHPGPSDARHAHADAKAAFRSHHRKKYK